MAVAVAVRASERAMPAFVLVGGCPSKQSLHHKNIANPGVPNGTLQALTFSDFPTCSSFRTIRHGQIEALDSRNPIQLGQSRAEDTQEQTATAVVVLIRDYDR